MHDKKCILLSKRTKQCVLANLLVLHKKKKRSTFELFLRTYIPQCLVNFEKYWRETLFKSFGNENELEFEKIQVVNYQLSTNIVANRSYIVEKLVDSLQNIVKIDSLNVAEEDPSLFTHYLDMKILDKGQYIAFSVQAGCTIKVQLERDNKLITHISVIAVAFNEKIRQIINLIEGLEEYNEYFSLLEEACKELEEGK